MEQQFILKIEEYAGMRIYVLQDRGVLRATLDGANKGCKRGMNEMVWLVHYFVYLGLYNSRSMRVCEDSPQMAERGIEIIPVGVVKMKNKEKIERLFREKFPKVSIEGMHPLKAFTQDKYPAWCIIGGDGNVYLCDEASIECYIKGMVIWI